MRSAVLLAVMVTATGCLNAPIPAEPGSAPALPSLVQFSKIHTPEEIAAEVESFAALAGVEVAELGLSSAGRPLQQVVLGEGPTVLWVVGRHHGNEPTGAEAILLAVRLLADPDAALPDDAPPLLQDLLRLRALVKERVTVVFVPVVNPDGADAFTRGNSMTPDPNRDYVAFHTPEARLVRDAFWAARPDACLDLHNEGLSDRFDYDAFVPIALPEAELQVELTESAWLAVREVDASGGFGGGPNENYHLGRIFPGPLDVGTAITNPTAVHPGTHDMFCSLRGAPGWTPEGAIPPAEEGGGNGGDHPVYAWSTRLHWITVATALLEAAGVYDGLAAPWVEKVEETMLVPQTRLTVAVPASGTLRLQVVWNPPASAGGQGLPAGVDFETPGGRVLSGGIPGPGVHTATVVIPQATAGAYTALIRAPPGTDVQFRVRLEPEQDAPVRVSREADGLTVENVHARTLTVRVADVLRPKAAGFSPAPSWSRLVGGPLAERQLAVWEWTLAPGQRVAVGYPEDAAAGPFRWTVLDGALAATGISGERGVL